MHTKSKLHSLPLLYWHLCTGTHTHTHLTHTHRTMAMSAARTPRIRLDAFCFRQFDNAEYTGTRLTGVSKEEFEAAVVRLVEGSPMRC